jgi:hypothetical protein
VNTRIKIGTAVIAGIAALTLAGCGGTSSTTASQSSSPSSSAAASSPTPTPSVSYTAAQQKFLNDMTAKYNVGTGSASDNANGVALGNEVCSGFQSGDSVSSVTTTVQQSESSFSASEVAGVVFLAGQDLCPQTPQAKAAAAAAKAAAAKASAAQAAAAKAAAAKAAAARAARIAAENTPISAAQWGRVTRSPDNYVGDIYTISGTVTQYDINSNSIATVESAALVATDANGNQFILEANPNLLGNVQPGQTFTAKVKVLGAVGVQSTTGGGTSEAPDFDAMTFSVTG